MSKIQNLSTEGQKSRQKQYDLEEGTLQFAKQLFVFVNKLPKTLTTIEISKQVVRSAGSVGANYIEANEAVSRKDFVLRIKICRKEAKETRYWLMLLECSEELKSAKEKLIQESTELMRIFGAILEKCKDQ
jgi:four helix bundle protein